MTMQELVFRAAGEADITPDTIAPAPAVPRTANVNMTAPNQRETRARAARIVALHSASGSPYELIVNRSVPARQQFRQCRKPYCAAQQPWQSRARVTNCVRHRS